MNTNNNKKEITTALLLTTFCALKHGPCRNSLPIQIVIQVNSASGQGASMIMMVMRRRKEDGDYQFVER